MTYKELQEALNRLTPEELIEDIAVYDPLDGEYYFIASLEKASDNNFPVFYFLVLR